MRTCIPLGILILLVSPALATAYPYPHELPGLRFYAMYLSPLRPYDSDLALVVRVLGSDQGREIAGWRILPLFVGKQSPRWAKDVTGRLASVEILPKGRVSMLKTKFPPRFIKSEGGVSEVNVWCDVYRDSDGLEYWVYAEDSAVGRRGDLMGIEYGPSDEAIRDVEGEPRHSYR